MDTERQRKDYIPLAVPLSLSSLSFLYILPLSVLRFLLCVRGFIMKQRFSSLDVKVCMSNPTKEFISLSVNPSTNLNLSTIGHSQRVVDRPNYAACLQHLRSLLPNFPCQIRPTRQARATLDRLGLPMPFDILLPNRCHGPVGLCQSAAEISQEQARDECGPSRHRPGHRNLLQ